MYPDSHLCSQSNLCTWIAFCLRPSLYHNTAPMPFSKSVTDDNNRTRNNVCTAIAPAREKTCTMTAKTALYPSHHRDSFPAKVPGQVLGWLRHNLHDRQPQIIPRPLIWHICFCATLNPTLMQKQKSQILPAPFD